MYTRFILLLLMLSSADLFGKIKNGYEYRIQGYRTTLQNLKLLLLEDHHLSFIESQKIKTEINDMIDFIAYYELTEKLIDQLRMVTPAIYNEIDSITDKKRRPTDVFIKLIPREQARIQLIAASFLAQGPTDEDANFSEHGEYSVSIEIWLSANALFLLCHELGHVKYIIPNLAAYSQFYQKHYSRRSTLSYIGHSHHDQSGKSAHDFEMKFLKDHANYLKLEGRKPESTFAMLREIRRKKRTLEADSSPISVEHVAKITTPVSH